MVAWIMERMEHNKIKGVSVRNCSIVMVWLKTSEQGRNIVTVTKNVGAGSEKSRSNVTVTKNVGAGRSRVGARSEQNMIHDKITK